jgi:hypothetical protein
MGLSMLAALVVPVSTALAVTCSGSGCNNTSPQTTGCSAGAVTKKSATIYDDFQTTKVIGKVELRYSPTCKTFWSRVTVLAPVDWGAYHVWETAIRSNSGAPNPIYQVEDDDAGLWNGDSAYSPQIYLPASSSDSYSGKACGYMSNGTVSSGDACTSYWTGV